MYVVLEICFKLEKSAVSFNKHMKGMLAEDVRIEACRHPKRDPKRSE